MQLPTENLGLIIQLAIQDDSPFTGKPGHGYGLSLISGFSRASQQFRQIALREVFKTFHVSSVSDLQYLDYFPDLYRWIRVMHCPVSVAVYATEQQYSRFTFLRAIHLWGLSSGLSIVLSRLPTSIREMTVPFDHNNNHREVLAASTRLSMLTHLRVARSRFEFPPAADVPYDDVPPHHYVYSKAAAEMLGPLRHLRILEIDHYLTDTECQEFHNNQCAWSTASSAYCPSCWIKFGEQTANAEITCTRIMAEGMQGLEVVIWKSWFTVNAEGHSRVFITREIDGNGREQVHIKRERDAIEVGWKHSVGRKEGQTAKVLEGISRKTGIKAMQ